MQNKIKQRYSKSERLFARARKVIPGGVQTLAKGHSQSPFGISPFYADKAVGAKVWDIDGNVYIDFVSSLMAIILGYADPDVNQAITRQLQSGSIFSLNHELEVQLSEKICDLIPSAEMVRFGKNGSDCTTAAVRLARGYSGRNKILVCGYHSWHDWYIGITKKSYGVPEVIKDLTHVFKFNDQEGYLQLFEKHKDDIAAVIIEPIQFVLPATGFLETIRATTQENNSLLIFDETITGFRYSLGSVQTILGVRPDLLVLGKGLSNGLPLSALAGPTELMKCLEKMFFSFTYAGEALSMAAALATINKLETHPVLPTLANTGTYLLEAVEQLIKEYQLEAEFEILGCPVRTHFNIKDGGRWAMADKKHLFSKTMFANGIINNTIHTINYAHRKEEVDQLINAYRIYFELWTKLPLKQH